MLFQGFHFPIALLVLDPKQLSVLARPGSSPCSPEGFAVPSSLWPHKVKPCLPRRRMVWTVSLKMCQLVLGNHCGSTLMQVSVLFWGFWKVLMKAFAGLEASWWYTLLTWLVRMPFFPLAWENLVNGIFTRTTKVLLLLWAWVLQCLQKPPFCDGEYTSQGYSLVCDSWRLAFQALSWIFDPLLYATGTLLFALLW